MNLKLVTLAQAKKDATHRLQAAGVHFDKVSAKTVNFTDLARAKPVFVVLHGVRFKGFGDALKAKCFADVPKPSEGGYVVQFEGGVWGNGDEI